MSYIITNNDLLTVQKNNIDISLKVEIIDENNQKIIGVITGNIINGGFTNDSNGDVRRSARLEIIPDPKSQITLGQEGLFWLDSLIKLYLGVNQGNDLKWYSQGCFYIKKAESTYDPTTNVLKIECNDLMVGLNGSKNGYLSAIKTVIPAYIEDKNTGKIIKYNTIRDVIIQTLTQLGHIKKYIVDDIGEYKAFPEHNKDWEKYREEHPLWNVLPYDLEFSAGESINSILSKLIKIYPNYEMFFDEDGTFICQMIPSCYDDDISIPNEFIEDVLISEDFSVDLFTVRNMCMVWGRTLEPDYFIESATYASNIYSATLEDYEKYRVRDAIAVKVPASNEDNCFLRINNLDALPIYDEVSGTFITKGTMKENTVYVFKLKYISKNDEEYLVAYLQGQWQAQALNVLVDGTESNELYELSTGEKVYKYSEEYFKKVYNCNTVSLTIIPNSPFTVQKLGEILDVKAGQEFSNIQSDSMALARAEYENWKNCRLTDSITIKTIITPFIDVNVKCTYRRSDKQAPAQYIIKSVSHSFSEGTTTWNMYKFQPLYQDTLDAIGTHKTLADYKHGLLGKYTHEQLAQFMPGGIY